MSENKLISIIVPIYNVEDYLQDCLESLIAQTYANLEILLIDDGSFDKSGEICERYVELDSRVFAFHFENEGLASARNRGLKLCKGDYVTFVDSDDWLDTDFCEKMLSEITRLHVSCVSCSFKEIYEDQEKIQAPFKTQLLNQSEFVEKVLSPQAGVSLACGKLWDMNFIKVNNLWFDTEVATIEDVLFHVKAAQFNLTVSLLSEPLYNYRFNPSSIVRGYRSDYSVVVEKSLLHLEPLLKNTKTNYGNYFDNFTVYFLMKIAVNYCFHPESHLNYLKKVQLFKQISRESIFNSAIDNSNYSELSLSRKVSLFVLKRRLYYFFSLIALFRQNQFKRW